MFGTKINIILGNGKMINKMEKVYIVNMVKKLKGFGLMGIYFLKQSELIVIYLEKLEKGLL